MLSVLEDFRIDKITVMINELYGSCIILRNLIRSVFARQEQCGFNSVVLKITLRYKTNSNHEVLIPILCLYCL